MNTPWCAWCQAAPHSVSSPCWSLLRLRWYRAHQHRLELLVAERTHALSRANDRLRLANETLAQESQTDPLTALHNRRFLLDNISALLRDGVGDGSGLAFLLLDLDNFKRVNDDFGHAAGDNVLVQLSQLLRSMARADDHLLRWGGEEFLIVLKRVQADQALETAERIRLKLAAHPFRLGDGRELRLTGSIGFAMHPPGPGAARRSRLDADPGTGRRSAVSSQTVEVAMAAPASLRGPPWTPATFPIRTCIR